MTYKKSLQYVAKRAIIIVNKGKGYLKMKVLEKHTRLIIAVLVLVIVMLSLALWSSTYINKVDDYYFKEYLNSADDLEH